MAKTFKIFRGCHYPFPIDMSGLKSLISLCRPGDSYVFSGIYSFNNDCQYDIGEDQSDVNKLVGVSFGFHQKNSIRVGWRYLKSGVIELCYYAYLNSKRLSTISIGTVDLESLFTLDICVGRSKSDHNVLIILRAQNREPVVKSFEYNLPEEKTYISYGLGIYFGGNRTAPHRMTIERQVDKAEIIHPKITD